MDKSNPGSDEKLIVWWKDIKFMSGLSFVILSIVLGLVGKGITFINITKPLGLTAGISIWLFSWLLLLTGIFLVGKETIKIIQQRINLYIKKAIIETYGYTTRLPKKSINYTKALHKKGMETLTKTFGQKKKK